MQLKVKLSLALLGLIIIGVLFLFLRKKSVPEDEPIEELPEELDDIPAATADEPEEPTPTTTPAKPLVPEKPKSSPPEDDDGLPPPPLDTTNEDVPVQPTPATTPAKPLIDKPRTPLFRLLTDKELAVLKQKVINSFPRPRVPEDKKTLWERKMEVYESCVLPIFIHEFLDLARAERVNDADVKLIMDPAKIQAKNASKGGFIPDRWEAVWMKDHDTRMMTIFNSCGPEPTRTRANTTLPSVNSVDVEPLPRHDETVIGVLGKFGNEGGVDVNNGVTQLHFKPAKTALVHIEHVDVHRGDPVNKNGSITFIYQGGIKHKFVFVGNGGLRFRKQDGSFGPNLGVGDVSKTVLTGMGLNYLTYKIECLRTAGRNTWRFKPLRLDRGLIGIELSDNADWGGLRGVYINVQSTGRSLTQVERHRQERNAMLSEFRRGWPNGTIWNIKGATGNDRQRCNDICKELGYNYFTHNPPPADGGCGCFKANVALSQLSMTDHANAKTRRVV